MGRGRNTINLAVMAHVYICVFPELGLSTKHPHLVELWENLLWLCCLGRSGLCLVLMCGDDSQGDALVKEALLFCRLGCYLVSWSVIDMADWVLQGSLYQNFLIPNGGIQDCSILIFGVNIKDVAQLW